ncbi:hypothetical protein [Nocardioides marmotae]|uniref:hypothetical protein n=1 Tax=Nocardioides marmotae TaxID=2663857 RepID=UPI001CA875D2|nr:hypothetical protein [Nocardioides marmotae]
MLVFVARRVEAERVGLMAAVRDSDEADIEHFAGLPALHLARLGGTDARELLASAFHTPLDDSVRERIVTEACGNPLALLELPRSAQAAQLAGGFELPDVRGVPHRVADSFQRRSAGLPAETRLLLLLAATDPTGEVELLWRAAARLGIEPGAAAPAEAAGLFQIGTLVRFRHPLVRSAIYRAATPPDRRRAHAALAAATDPLLDPDRRAWHRAQAVQGTDEDAAAELEHSADRALARGGLAAAAAFLQQAVVLTPEPAARARRALEAAHAKHDAGASDVALELLGVADTGPLDALPRARLGLLRAQIAFHTRRGSDEPTMLLQAAKALAPLDAARARGLRAGVRGVLPRWSARRTGPRVAGGGRGCPRRPSAAHAPPAGGSAAGRTDPEVHARL